jgi:hypothetical protein
VALQKVFKPTICQGFFELRFDKIQDISLNDIIDGAMPIPDQANDCGLFIFSKGERAMRCFGFILGFTPNFSSVGAFNHKRRAEGGCYECYAAFVLYKIVHKYDLLISRLQCATFGRAKHCMNILGANPCSI